MAADQDVTALLEAWGRGEAGALDRLVPVVYDELRKLAESHLRRENSLATLQPTALVHEAYLRLVGQREVHYQNRGHFFGAAAQIIRRVLVDHARRKRAAKRDGGAVVTLEDGLAAAFPKDVELMALDAALNELEQFDRDKARIVELRYFLGLSIPDTAEAMRISQPTLKREWALARAWLYDRLHGSMPAS
jgi:RNA polymerase sigma-70 factor (ECF subfamily)